jgi:penicillin amidase
MKRFSFARRTPSHILGIGFALLTILICGGLFAFILVTRSAPKTDGSEEVRGISGEVSLYRNEYGIVHVIASSDADAYFGIGYAHAQDRLWQMDFQRRIGKGQLSAVFGRTTLEQDIFLRSMRFDSLAARLYRNTAPEARTALDAYTRGVNAYMETNKGRLAFEFDALDYEPEPWKPEDCLLLQRLWAWEMSSAFTLDLTLSAIADSLGNERTRALLPPFASNEPYYAPSVLDSLLPKKPTQASMPQAELPRVDSLLKSTTSTVSTGSVSFIPSPYPLPKGEDFQKHPRPLGEGLAQRGVRDNLALHHLAASIQHIREMSQMRGSAIGSNVWATRPSSFFHQETDTLRDTTNGQILVTPRVLPERYRHGALVANDLHTPFSTPTRFYEAHLTSPSLNVVGLMLPGMPFVLSGRNDKCAWGMANMMLDDTDYFLETLDSTNLKQIITPSGAKEKFFFITDTIYVKDSSIAVVDTRYTKRSCVISDFPTLQNGVLRGVQLRTGTILAEIQDSLQKNAQKPLQSLLQRQAQAQRCITYSWTGQYLSDDAAAYLRLNKAQSLADARVAVQTIGAPAVNLASADTDGNITMIPAGAVPERLERHPFTGWAHPNFLRRGKDTTDAWQRLVSAASMGELANPTSGRVIAANNSVQRPSSNQIHLSLLWDAPSRAARISEYMQDFEHLSARNMGIMQTDVRSHTAQMLVSAILPDISATSATARMRISERQALKLLASWNFELDAHSAAASIYTVFLERYAYNTLADKLSEPLYRQYVAISRLPLRAMLHLSQAYNTADSTTTWWFDNKATSRIESRADVVRQSFTEAVDYLLKRMNTDSVEAWHYGALHQMTLRHAFSEQLSPNVPYSLKHATELGPYPLSGDGTTLFGAEWSFNVEEKEQSGKQGFMPMLGSTARMVCDMQDTLVYVSCVGGNSGEVFTKAASNQLPLWLNNVMLPISIHREPHSDFTRRLVLVPIPM